MKQPDFFLSRMLLRSGRLVWTREAMAAGTGGPPLPLHGGNSGYYAQSPENFNLILRQ